MQPSEIVCHATANIEVGTHPSRQTLFCSKSYCAVLTKCTIEARARVCQCVARAQLPHLRRIHFFVGRLYLRTVRLCPGAAPKQKPSAPAAAGAATLGAAAAIAAGGAAAKPPKVVAVPPLDPNANADDGGAATGAPPGAPPNVGAAAGAAPKVGAAAGAAPKVGAAVETEAVALKPKGGAAVDGAEAEEATPPKAAAVEGAAAGGARPNAGPAVGGAEMPNAGA